MIYIFRSCDACAKGCSAAVGALCSAVGSLCTPLCKVLDRPLGSYAFLTGVVNALSCLLAILSLGDDMRCPGGESTARRFAMVNVAVSIIHAGFALYLQQRLVRGLQRNAALGHQSSTARQLMKEAGDIVLYDVGFCLYVFFFIAAFFLQFWGFSVLGDCRDAGTAWGSASLQVLFCLVAVTFGFCWSCAMQCSDCCGLFSSGAQGQPLSGGMPGQPQQQHGPVGLTRLIVGSSNLVWPPPPVPGAAVMGTPVQPQAQPYAAYQPHVGTPVQPPVQPYAAYQPHAASSAPSAPPPEPQEPPRHQQATVAGTAAEAAAGALSAAGKGLQAAGRFIGRGR